MINRKDPITGGKDQTPVHLDTEIDFSQFHYDPSSHPPQRYKLVAAIVHRGQNLTSGHYVALKILPERDLVLVFNDEEVEQKSFNYLSKRPVKREVYMAFYVRIDPI